LFFPLLIYKALEVRPIREKFITLEETKARSRALERTTMTRQNTVNCAPRKSQAFPRLILLEEENMVLCSWSDRTCPRQVIGPSVLHTRMDFKRPESRNESPWYFLTISSATVFSSSLRTCHVWYAHSWLAGYLDSVVLVYNRRHDGHVRSSLSSSWRSACQ
jgi:hypothetical protein